MVPVKDDPERKSEIRNESKSTKSEIKAHEAV
jgi:hypothetical protein